MKNRDKLALHKEQKIRKMNLLYEEDYELFAREQIKIRPKDVTRGMIPFHFNQAQKKIHDKIEEQRKATGKVRAIVLKARQQGISTYCTGRVFWKTDYMPLSRSVVMAHDSATSEALFSMSKDINSNMDSDYKPELAKSNAKEILFVKRKKNDKGEEIEEHRGYRLYTAGSPEAGRGTTPTVAHLSEVAFWQYDDKILAGLFQGIPSSKGTEVILESTANGIAGEFYRLWKSAEKGENEYVPIFIPWFITDEYRNDDVPPKFELSEDEEKYRALHLLDMPQMYWRRLKIGESGPVKFQQEYPATAEEAFVASGINIFDMDILNAVVPTPPLRQSRMDFNSGQFEQNAYGELFIYKYPQFADRFIVAGDVSLGVGQDSSVATVMDANRNICAIYRNDRLDPTKYGDLLFYLGRYYNNALLCVESNSIGVATLARLDQMKYPNIYYQTDIQKLSNEEGKRPGFRTTSATRPAIIGLLKNAIKERDVKLNDSVLIQELKEFVLRDNGKAEALPGCHDDHVISLAICLEVYRTHADKLTNTRIGFENKQAFIEDTDWL
jgi:hypothetical protein